MGVKFGFFLFFLHICKFFICLDLEIFLFIFSSLLSLFEFAFFWTCKLFCSEFFWTCLYSEFSVVDEDNIHSVILFFVCLIVCNGLFMRLRVWFNFRPTNRLPGQATGQTQT